MTMIDLLIVLVGVGVVLYLINNFIPMSPPVRTVLNAMIVLIFCVWFLRALGIADLGIPIRRR